MLCNQEKSGSSNRPKKQMTDFRQAIEDCALAYMSYYGPKFTRCNGREASLESLKELIDF